MDFASERDWYMKLGMHRKFYSKPAEGSKHVRTPKKATMLREQPLNEAEKIQLKEFMITISDASNIDPSWIDIKR